MLAATDYESNSYDRIGKRFPEHRLNTPTLPKEKCAARKSDLAGRFACPHVIYRKRSPGNRFQAKIVTNKMSHYHLRGT
jgi:hypothetical protein